MTQINRQIVLASRPVGEPKTSDFNLTEGVPREPDAGEVLCRTVYLSLDPYMRAVSYTHLTLPTTPYV